MGAFVRQIEVATPPADRRTFRRVVATELIDTLRNDPNRRISWEAWIGRLSAALGDAPVLLALGSTRPGARGTVVTAGIAAEFRRAYVQHYYAYDPWVARMAGMSSRIAFGYEVLPRPLLLRNEFYTGWMAPQAFHDVPTINGVIRGRLQRTATLSIFRGRTTPMLQLEDVALLRELVPHLQRVLARQPPPARHGHTLERVRQCA